MLESVFGVVITLLMLFCLKRTNESVCKLSFLPREYMLWVKRQNANNNAPKYLLIWREVITIS